MDWKERTRGLRDKGLALNLPSPDASCVFLGHLGVLYPHIKLGQRVTVDLERFMRRGTLMRIRWDA